MTWEPKQGDVVAYAADNNKQEWATFVCVYQDKYLLDDDGDYIQVDSIKRIVIEEEPEITVGSVWENEDGLWVLNEWNNVKNKGVVLSTRTLMTMDVFSVLLSNNFKPRPDKIGMAPALIKTSYGIIISSTAFRNAEHASKNLIRDTLIAWPANNSMWVIVDK